MTLTAAQRATGHVRFLLGADPTSDDLLIRLIEGLAAGLERPTQVAHGTPDCPGERVLTDPRCAPFWALPYAAQYVGGTLPPRPAGMSDADYETYARAAVVRPFGALRGSPEALTVVAQQYLTGQRRVRIIERYNGDPWVTMVLVAPSELTDQAALTAALNRSDNVIAGMRVDVVAVEGITWDELAAGGTTWDDLTTAGTTWDDLAEGNI